MSAPIRKTSPTIPLLLVFLLAACPGPVRGDGEERIISTYKVKRIGGGKPFSLKADIFCRRRPLLLQIEVRKSGLPLLMTEIDSEHIISYLNREKRYCKIGATAENVERLLSVEMEPEGLVAVLQGRIDENGPFRIEKRRTSRKRGRVVLVDRKGELRVRLTFERGLDQPRLIIITKEDETVLHLKLKRLKRSRLDREKSLERLLPDSAVRVPPEELERIIDTMLGGAP